jgi:hypothetical protein
MGVSRNSKMRSAADRPGCTIDGNFDSHFAGWYSFS